MRLVGSILFFCLVANFSFSQYTESEVREMIKEADEQQLVVEASRMLQENYYYFSELVVDRLLEIKPTSPNYNYRKGFIILESRWDLDNALKHFEIAVTDVDKNFDMYSSKELSCPQDVYYHIARCYHLDEQMDKAIEYFNKFIAVSNPKSELLPKAKLKIIQCNLAKQLIPNPINAQVKNLGKAINQNVPDYSPMISWDGTALYYTSRRQWKTQETDAYKDPMFNHYPEDIYVAYTLDGMEWNEPERLEFCDPKLNEATVYVSKDEKKIYTYNDSEGNGDIFYSELKNHHYLFLEKFQQPGLNTDFWETHAAVANDGNTIFFVSNRKGGLGGRDIYYIRKDANGKWSEPINMGPEVNTIWDEESPFLSIDNKTLYFSSNGEKSMGEFDIFSIQLENLKPTGAAKNLGYPVNTTGDDLFYTTTADGRTAYLSSFRRKGLGEKDIYQIIYPEGNNAILLSGDIKYRDGRKVPSNLNLVLTCESCATREVKLGYRERDNAFIYNLEDCRTYTLKLYDSVPNNQKELYTNTFKTNCNKQSEHIIKEIRLGDEPIAQVIDTVKPITDVKFENPYLKHMYTYNAHVLTTEAGNLKAFITQIDEQIAKGRKNVVINITSSASNVPTATFKTNDKLAKARAEKIKNQLDSYFASKKENVRINIVKAVVAGPKYDNDASNTSKYEPFQFIELKVE
jgi:tetratricopeptide (TPR) repeat protein